MNLTFNVIFVPGTVFCFMDSDIFATSWFAQELERKLVDCDVFSAGYPLSMDPSLVVPGFVGLCVRTPADVPLATTFFAVYRRQPYGCAATRSSASPATAAAPRDRATGSPNAARPDGRVHRHRPAQSERPRGWRRSRSSSRPTPRHVALWRNPGSSGDRTTRRRFPPGGRDRLCSVRPPATPRRYRPPCMGNGGCSCSPAGKAVPRPAGKDEIREGKIDERAKKTKSAWPKRFASPRSGSVG